MPRSSILALALAGALSLGGCSELSSIFGPSVATTTLQDSEKALAAAHLAHAAAADGLVVAAASGTLKGPDAKNAKALLDQSESYLLAADNAVTLGNATDIQTQTAEATALVAQVNALIHPAK